MDVQHRLPATVRKSLPLTDRDMQDLARLRRNKAHLDALGRLVRADLDESSSEAALLHAVMEAGLRAVREQVEADGYAAIAAERAPEERRRVARRRPPAWADE